MTSEEIRFSTSFLLGKIHGGMMFILNDETSAEYKVRQLADLELEVRTAIEKLFYTKEQ